VSLSCTFSQIFVNIFNQHTEIENKTSTKKQVSKTAHE